LHLLLRKGYATPSACLPSLVFTAFGERSKKKQGLLRSEASLRHFIAFGLLASLLSLHI
jgi:hypothetical protein